MYVCARVCVCGYVYRNLMNLPARTVNVGRTVYMKRLGRPVKRPPRERRLPVSPTDPSCTSGNPITQPSTAVRTFTFRRNLSNSFAYPFT